MEKRNRWCDMDKCIRNKCTLYYVYFLLCVLCTQSTSHITDYKAGLDEEVKVEKMYEIDQRICNKCMRLPSMLKLMYFVYIQHRANCRFLSRSGKNGVKYINVFLCVCDLLL